MTTVREEWERCRPWIEKALVRGADPHSIQEVEAFISEGKAQFWPGKKAAMVTEIIGNGTKVLSFWLIGGETDDSLGEIMLGMRPAIETWAKAQGCSSAIGIFCMKRRGWQRAAARFGYLPSAITLVKEL